MKIIGIIPARFNSTRFPGKPLELIDGKPMVQWVYENCSKTKLFDHIYIATDDKLIQNTCRDFGASTFMTAADHRSGTDRVFEVADQLNLNSDDIVINVQGDLPFVDEKAIRSCLVLSRLNEADITTIVVEKFFVFGDYIDKNNVKCIFNDRYEALYFSRSPIPYIRNGYFPKTWFKHIGIYSYKFAALTKFVSLKRGDWEKFEGLEQLRALQNGMKIKVSVSSEIDICDLDVNVPADIVKAEKILKGRK